MPGSEASWGRHSAPGPGIWGSVPVLHCVCKPLPIPVSSTLLYGAWPSLEHSPP